MAPALVAVSALAAVSVLAVFGAQAVLHVAARRAATSSRCPGDEPPPAAWLRTMVREAVLSLRVVAAWPARARAPAGGGSRAVVLVHGFASSPASLWLLARRLRRGGWPVALPRLGRWWRDVGDGAERLATHLEGLRAEHGYAEFVLVAHGAGGLAARLLVLRAGRRAGVRRLVTLGTPHGGTTACRWLRLGPFRHDVRPGSALLRSLAAPLPPFVDAIAIASPNDVLVVPSDLAYWREACNISVQGSGHLDLVFSGRVYELIRENLAPPAPVACLGRAD